MQGKQWLVRLGPVSASRLSFFAPNHVHFTSSSSANSQRRSYSDSEAASLAFAGESSSSSNDRHEVQNSGPSRAQEEAKASSSRNASQVLSRESQFFSFLRQRTVDQDSDSMKPERHRILAQCDASIILSRDCSNAENYGKARSKLHDASKVFFRVFHKEEAKGVKVEMGYEMFLLRSTWIQVVRTILALEGHEQVEICVLLMHDYLRWERMVMEAGIKTQDGTESLPSPQAVGEGVSKMMEERYFFGPFVQDAAPVLYDIFRYLTGFSTNKVAPLKRRMANQVIPKAYRRKRHYKLAVQLWDTIAQIPSERWRNPMSYDWLRLCDRTPFKDGQHLIASCMLHHGLALINRGQLRDSYTLWLSGLELFSGSCRIYSGILISRILFCLKVTKSIALDSSGRQDGKPAPPGIVNVLEYVDTVNLLIRTVSGVNKYTWRHGTPNAFLGNRMDELLSLFLSLEKVRTSISPKRKNKSSWQAERLIVTCNGNLRAWIGRWFSKQGEHAPLPRLNKASTCNKVVQHLLLGTPGFGPSRDLAVKFLQEMSINPKLPKPDSVSTTILLRGANEGGREMIDASLRLATMQMQKKDAAAASAEEADAELGRDDNQGAWTAEEEPPSILVLIDDAVRQGDVHRLTALLKAVIKHQHLLSATRMGQAHSQMPRRASRSEVHSIVFSLYPSLDAIERRLRVDHGEDSSTPIRDELSNSVVFDQRILLLVLNMLVNKGHTGLAERVWRMVKRTSLRKTHSQKDTAEGGWPIPIQAYTLMMKLYASEVRRGSRAALSSMSGATFRRASGRGRPARVSDGLVRGWAVIKTGPRANIKRPEMRLRRDVAARDAVRAEYRELKDRWAQGSATEATLPFWTALLSVFRQFGDPRKDFDLRREADVTFLASIKEDMDPLIPLACTLPPASVK